VRLQDFNVSLQTRNQTWAGRQQPDGSWAPCTAVFFVKLSVSLEGITSHYESKTKLAYPLTFIADSALSNITALTGYLRRLLVSDIALTGVNMRSELSNVITVVSRLVSWRAWVNVALEGMHISESFSKRYLGFLDSFQDSATGYWGAQYCDRATGQVYGSNDLSITFHVTKYRQGGIKHLVSMAHRTLALKDSPYPYGWGVQACDRQQLQPQ